MSERQRDTFMNVVLTQQRMYMWQENCNYNRDNNDKKC